MIGICDTCGRQSELFQLPGRKDSNCAECNSDISMLVLLYRKLASAEQNGGQTEEVEAQLGPMLRRFLERSPRFNSVPSEQIQRRYYIN